MKIPPLPIHSGQGDYEVTFPPNVADLVTAMLAVPRAIVVIDQNVASTYAAVLEPLLLSSRPTLLVSATE
ncbi:MAG: hypothetical protein WCK17_11495, partial [Verrucomicrobiota bacterium]